MRRLFTAIAAVLLTVGTGQARPAVDAIYGLPPVAEVKDPTGAGDAFRAGFVKGLALDKPLDVAARMGSVSAAYAVEKHGTQEHTFTWQEFADRYAAAFGSLK